MTRSRSTQERIVTILRAWGAPFTARRSPACAAGGRGSIPAARRPPAP